MTLALLSLAVIAVAAVVAGVWHVRRSRQPAVPTSPGGAPVGAPARTRTFRPAGRPSTPDPGPWTTSTGGFGAKLGDGGQGTIYEIPGDPSRVVKIFLTSIPNGLRDFTAVLDAHPLVAADLRGLPISLCWPESPVTSGPSLDGYVMPRIPPDFYFATPKDAGSKRRPRDLSYATPTNSAFDLPRALTEEEARELVRLVAEFLRVMHRHDLVYGDVSWANLTYCLDPVRLCVHDFDAARRLGVSSIAAGPVNTPDWNDPLAGDSPVSTFDSDRYKFALLAYRVLVSKDRHAPLPATPHQSALAPDEHGLGHLWSRAAGPLGTRPQISEWCRMLGPAAPDAPLTTAS